MTTSTEKIQYALVRCDDPQQPVSYYEAKRLGRALDDANALNLHHMIDPDNNPEVKVVARTVTTSRTDWKDIDKEGLILEPSLEVFDPDSEPPAPKPKKRGRPKKEVSQ